MPAVDFIASPETRNDGQGESESRLRKTEQNIVEQNRAAKTPTPTNWGRAWEIDLLNFACCAGMLLTCPLLPLFFYIACDSYQCSLVDQTQYILGEGLFAWFRHAPAVTFKAFQIYGVWFVFQVALSILPDILHKILPRYVGGVQDGAITPAGRVNQYNVNGLQSWLIAHSLWMLNAFYFNWFSPTIIFDNMGSFFYVVNALGYAVSIFAYVKGHFFPTHADDCKFSQSVLYDFMMGAEFNPRIGKWFDFKLFFNGRPGITAWTLTNLSFAWHQYHTYGYVSNGMVALNILQMIYVVDFFWNESWYLKTIDICHDHFGWYLGWGDCVWLPFMYTLQGLYLAYNPVVLPTWYLSLIMALGLSGYYIFRSSNCQKDQFRKLKDKYLINGEKPSYIDCHYMSLDGAKHYSTLLTSGWWGWSRHANYTGDLMGALAYSLCCGFDHLLPYFYAVYLTILLVHRLYRDEHRCSHKYGKFWTEYCSKVPYRLLPGLY